MNIKINKATIEDFDTVLGYLNKFMSLRLEGISLRPNGMNKDEVIKKLPESTDCTNRLCLIAQSEKEIVGCLTFSRHPKIEYRHSGEFGMTVLPVHWRKGIGISLMCEMEKWCRSNHFRKIELSVWSSNKPAIALYEKLGYETEGRRKRSIIRDSKIYDLILMGKWLG